MLVLAVSSGDVSRLRHEEAPACSPLGRPPSGAPFLFMDCRISYGTTFILACVDGTAAALILGTTPVGMAIHDARLPQAKHLVLLHPATITSE